MNKDFKLFIGRLLLFGLPVLALVASYFIFDPFYVLRDYDAYPDNYLKSYNRNRISTQVFLNNNKEQNYKSFIFGSSKSSSFRTADWATYINDPVPYHFDASNEDIVGIASKLAFIDKQGNSIENILLVFDDETFADPSEREGSVIHLKDPLWSGESKFSYHLTFFKSFFKDQYFWKFFDALINKKFKKYMYGVIMGGHILYTPINNDFIFKDPIDKIKADSLGYYSQKDLFYDRKDSYQESNKVIGKEQENYLKEIKNIVQKHATNVEIIISPSYNQISFNKTDLAILKSYFGSSHVHDFSGINDLTQPVGNFYEIYHYKPFVAREVLKRVYK